MAISIVLKNIDNIIKYNSLPAAEVAPKGEIVEKNGRLIIIS